jgi:hypothetical protein
MKFRTDETRLVSLALHKVGNSAANDGLYLSDALPQITDETASLLLHYFLSPFTTQEFYRFSHASDLAMNEVFHYVSSIFDQPAGLLTQSQHLGSHLYRHSAHPRVKTGEFYVVCFEHCLLDDEVVDAVGLFKSESKDTFLTIYPSGNTFEIGYGDGININRLDKGCLIFNTNREEGYLCALVDNLARGSEAQYWRDDFLQVTPRSDNYFRTRSVMEMTRQFVTETLPRELGTDRASQADLLNRSVHFMKQNDAFDLGEFRQQVLTEPEIIDAFSGFCENRSEETGQSFPDAFGISGDAVKKQTRFMKSVIKLDKNFHIYVHGDRQMVEKGFDEERQLEYYKLFFREEQ